MQTNEILSTILSLILTVILPFVTACLTKLMKAKIQESTAIQQAAKNEAVSTLIKEALCDVMDAVLYVNQVYTDTLKAAGTFDQEAQKKAFEMAYTEAGKMISQEAKQAIEELYGSFEDWLKSKIEADVQAIKKQ